MEEGRRRVVISNVSPQIEAGRFAIKRVIGEEVVVEADIFTDGHYKVAAYLYVRSDREAEWQEIVMEPKSNDRWLGRFITQAIGMSFYNIIAWIDYFETWQKDLEKKFKAASPIEIDLQIGLQMIQEALCCREEQQLREWLLAIEGARNQKQAILLATDPTLTQLMRNCYPNRQWETTLPHPLPLSVDPPKAGFSAWYELFPRSSGEQSGTFKDCEELLPGIAKMGFDVLYLSPIHPIGISKRKGKNNSSDALAGDLGSPWAIGSQVGGHKTIHPELGTEEELRHFVQAATYLGLDVALDIAFQCSLDHPYVKEHPNWFRWRPDQTIQYAENPPKKYEDIVPFFFETEAWQALWEELRSIFLHWIRLGIKIFRIDNPHTKPFPFWEWVIRTIKQDFPDVIFLAEAFTRPKVMYWLAKIGFSQSYTYFAWRHTKQELIEYLTELTSTDLKEYFRPNFWPNTPDILTEELQMGNKATFMVRFALAATLSSNYGIYGPAFELMIQDALPGTEEYRDSEKYERKRWNRNDPKSLASFIAQINQIRRENEALHMTANLQFLPVDNANILCYGKFCENPSNNLLIVVSLDAFNLQEGTLTIPLEELGIQPQEPYRVHELLSDRYAIWEGGSQPMILHPKDMPVKIFRIQRRLLREMDFEYFM
ncbi:putative glycosidase [Candidatus Protochlamydia naegleriophila]|uniref:Alpha-1,4-glucan:maltose-1-phosphate maltosyltransferase n=1 Tax=Candidatus Protochlamydia naegleriophila TaxID=389348 RepID=A0A0U5CMG6_9BACT|nr:alpha-1,4-glucan--maltose-1-phosphate maltosyltransferase [Candidatus Protochlamydia naegleriophila]CUI15772.1 putative glycosidase [Candidatus Protochlamydia naegleriophila]